MKAKLTLIIGLCTLLVLSLNPVYASEKIDTYEIYDTNAFEEMLEQEDINSGVNKIELDEDVTNLTSTDINTLATDKVLWNENYVNKNSVKKDIYEKNYGVNAKPGVVRINIENLGNTTIKVNIYQSWWNSRTIAYGEVAPGRSKTFVIGEEYGGYDCASVSCYAFQKFTISAYSNNGRISFNGYAKIYY